MLEQDRILVTWSVIRRELPSNKKILLPSELK